MIKRWDRAPALGLQQRTIVLSRINASWPDLSLAQPSCSAHAALLVLVPPASMTASPNPAAAAAVGVEHQDLVRRLAAESHAFDVSGCDPERNCWMVVHRHLHGVLPSEYDIREVDEALYLEVLDARRRGC